MEKQGPIPTMERHELSTPTTPSNSPKTYNLLLNNVIPVKKNQHIRVSIPEIRVGFTHRDPAHCSGIALVKQRWICAYEFSSEKGLGGRDYWLLIDMIGLDRNDPLGLRQTRIFRASYVKQDQLSYGFLPLEEAEQIVFDGISDLSYQITVKLYSVHAPDHKKDLYALGGSSVLLTAWNALYGLATATGNFLAKDVIDAIRQKTKEDPSFVERILLQASAELEISGTAQLLLSDSVSSPKRDYLLYDIIKSRYDRDYDGKLDDDVRKEIEEQVKQIKDDFKDISYVKSGNLPNDFLLRLPRSQDEYELFFRIIYSSGPYNIESPDDLRNRLTTIDQLTRDQLTRSYIRIHVDTVSP